MYIAFRFHIYNTAPLPPSGGDQELHKLNESNRPLEGVVTADVIERKRLVVTRLEKYFVLMFFRGLNLTVSLPIVLYTIHILHTI